eukprot:3702114-Pyramimonas_sp.AAC.1
MKGCKLKGSQRIAFIISRSTPRMGRGWSFVAAFAMPRLPSAWRPFRPLAPLAPRSGATRSRPGLRKAKSSSTEPSLVSRDSRGKVLI